MRGGRDHPGQRTAGLDQDTAGLDQDTAGLDQDTAGSTRIRQACLSQSPSPVSTASDTVIGRSGQDGRMLIDLISEFTLLY